MVVEVVVVVAVVAVTGVVVVVVVVVVVAAVVVAAAAAEVVGWACLTGACLWIWGKPFQTPPGKTSKIKFLNES